MAGVRQFDEAKVLAAVLDVFWRKGWEATSMADLAEAAEVQRGSLYHAYGGKEPLFLLAFDTYAARFQDEARKALAAPGARAALDGFYAVAIRNMTTGRPSRGCLTTKTATQAEAVGPAIRKRLARLVEDLRQLVREALSAEPARSQLALPPEDAAEVVVTFTRGLAVMERIEGDPARLRRTAAALVTGLVREDA